MRSGFYLVVFKIAPIISARKSAPNDGTGQVSGRPVGTYSHSKQNSDAAGMMYNWGRKDPFTFATSSLKGGPNSWDYGKYPVKIYNGKLELIYQEDGGRTNSGNTPIGGVIAQNRLASSMIEAIKKPNLFYGGNSVISQVGHSKELWNYYWTSYSRGTDGRYNPTTITWHNTYLDGYIVLRPKSIYDPCPYGYRTPTNGTYNDFKSNSGWTIYSYTGGAIWNNCWIPSGRRSYNGYLDYYGYAFGLYSSTSGSAINTYGIQVSYNLEQNLYWLFSKNHSWFIRCIEDATVKAD